MLVRPGGGGLRIAGIVLVFLLTLGAFATGVATSGIPDMAAEGVLAWTYYAAGLFVFGGLDLGAPVGGPGLGRAALWAAYSLAPTITTTAVIEAALRVIRPRTIQRGGLKSHVILVGGGPVGLAYLQAIRRVERDRRVLLVVEEGTHTNVDELERLGRVAVLHADLRRPATLDSMAIGRAERMVVVNDDDLVNLETAWAAKARRPELPVAVHVADLTLLRPLNRLIRDQAVGEGGARDPLVFNTHRIGALHLYETHLMTHFRETGYRDVLILGGFGRFAQTILELLRVTEAEDLDRIIVVDEEAQRKLRQFEADVTLGPLLCEAVDGDLEDPGTWAAVDEILSGIEAAPIYLFASSEEVVNFRAAMLLRGRTTEPRAFVRCFHRTGFAESLADQLSVELLASDEVLREALNEHCEGLRML